MNWLLPKCKYALTNCDDINYVKRRFCDLYNSVLRIVKTQDVYNKESIDFNKLPVIEQKQGHWILYDDDYNAYECSACGEIWCLNDGTPKENNMNFCMKCGAKMDEKVCPFTHELCDGWNCDICSIAEENMSKEVTE